MSCVMQFVGAVKKSAGTLKLVVGFAAVCI
jgi:hypothetical protein